MGIGDILVELFVQLTSKKILKPMDDTDNLIDSIFGIMWIKFVNLGFKFLFVSLDVEIIALNKVGILNGQYNTFNSMWYIMFGKSIILRMILQLTFPHIATLVNLILYKIIKCYDQKCSGDSKITR